MCLHTLIRTLHMHAICTYICIMLLHTYACLPGKLIYRSYRCTFGANFYGSDVYRYRWNILKLAASSFPNFTTIRGICEKMEQSEPNSEKIPFTAVIGVIINQVDLKHKSVLTTKWYSPIFNWNRFAIIFIQ